MIIIKDIENIIIIDNKFFFSFSLLNIIGMGPRKNIPLKEKAFCLYVLIKNE